MKHLKYTVFLLTMVTCWSATATFDSLNLKGVASVDNLGSAKYSIPIDLPTGPAGIRPAVSLEYNHKFKNGFMGVGWQINGLSSITRCNSNIAQEGLNRGISFTSTDRFCLDGKKLFEINGVYGANGTEYRAEFEDFSRVYSFGNLNGPTQFKVFSKNGSTLFYGISRGSSLQSSTQAGTLTWYLNEVVDLNGNRTLYHYYNDLVTGESYPWKIEYGSASAIEYSLEFIRENRPDPIYNYRHGGVYSQLQRLASIKVFKGTTPLYSYPINYRKSLINGRSLATQIEVKSESGVPKSLIPTSFIWSGGMGDVHVSAAPPATILSGKPVTTKLISGIPGNGSGGIIPNSNSVWAAGDFNGDGMSDFIQVVPGTTDVMVCHGGLTETDFQCYRSVLNIPLMGAGEIKSGDFDGDGFTDFVQFFPYSGTAFYCYSDGGVNFECVIKAVPGLGTTGNKGTVSQDGAVYVETNYTIVDINGDGRSDILQFAILNGSVIICPSGHDRYANPLCATKVLPSFSAFNILIGDFNGDGSSDIAYAKVNPAFTGASGVSPVLGSKILICYSDILLNFDCQEKDTIAATPSAVCTTGSGLCVSPFFTGDFNGDGNADIAQFDSQGFVNVYFTSTPTSPLNMVREYNAGFAEYGIEWSKSKLIYVGDLNGDGKSDIFHNPNPEFNAIVLYAKGNGNFESKIGPSMPEESFLSGNFLGDRNLSFLQVNRTQSNVLMYHSPYSVFDLISGIDSGLGEKTLFNYKSMTDSTVYQKENFSVYYPYINAQIPNWIVAALTQDQGNGVKRRFSYNYSGAKIDLSGRGFLGYSSVTKHDDGPGTIEHTQFNLEMPLTGRVKRSSFSAKKAKADFYQTVRDINYEYQTTKYPYTRWVSGESNRWLVQDSITTEYVHDFETAALLTTKTVSNKYDDFGSLLQSTTTHFDTVQGKPKNEIFRSTTSYTLENFTGDPNSAANQWYLGLIKFRETTNVNKNSAITRLAGFEYDSKHRLITEHYEPSNRNNFYKNQFTYDVFGNILTKTTTGSKMVPRVETNTYSLDGMRLASRSNGVETVGYTYDSFGNVITETDSNARATNFQYDSLGKLIKITRPDATETNFELSVCSTSCVAGERFLFTETRTGFSPRTKFFDSINREVRSSRFDISMNQVNEYKTYDRAGNVSKITLPSTGSSVGDIKLFYDSLGRKIREVNPKGDVVTWSYNRFTMSETKSNGFVNSVTTDSLGNKISVQNNEGSLVVNTFDAFGNLVKSVDGLGNTSTYRYDVLGRNIEYRDSSFGLIKKEYNGIGEQIKEIANNGDIFSLTFNAQGRLVGRTLPDMVSSWTYSPLNAVGSLGTSTNSGGVTKNITYDTLGRVSSISTVIDSNTMAISYTYDSAGRVEVITYPGGFAVKNKFASNGELVEVVNNTSNATIWKLNSQNANRQATSEQLGNGIVLTKEFDPLTYKPLHFVASPSSGPVIQSLSLSYDNRGIVQSRSDLIDPLLGNKLTEHYSYDNIDRLKKVIGPNNQDFKYSSSGQIVAKSDVGQYSYSSSGSAPGFAVKKIQNGSASTEYLYDNRGNMLSGDGRTFTWNSFNKPNTISNSSISVSYFYDPELQRVKTVKSSCKDYLGNTVANCIKYEIDPGHGGIHFEREVHGGITTNRSFIYAGQRNPVAVQTSRSDGSLNIRFLIKDHQNSVYAIADASGNVVERLSYDAFGKRRNVDGTSDAGNAIRSEFAEGYTLHEHIDEGGLGLINMGGRIYDPKIGRFISADPVQGSIVSTQDMDRYTYGRNSPTHFDDPSGLFLGEIARAIGQAWDDTRNAIEGGFKNMLGDEERRILGYGLAFLMPYQSGVLLNTTTTFQDNFAFSQGDVNNLNTYYAGMAIAGTAAVGGVYVAPYFSLTTAALGGVGSVATGAAMSGYKSWAEDNNTWQSFFDGVNLYFEYGDAPISDFVSGFVVGGFSVSALKGLNSLGTLGEAVIYIGAGFYFFESWNKGSAYLDKDKTSWEEKNVGGLLGAASAGYAIVQGFKDSGIVKKRY